MLQKLCVCCLDTQCSKGGSIYNELTPSKIVGLLWADQNMRDFGANNRLLTSSERSVLWGMQQKFTGEELKNLESNKYFQELNFEQARCLDNVNI
ncbi:hypothetical protein [Pseudoalteromonas phage vB_PtuP_Slicky01]|nr:hypothetical protein [Pseudoalteromonas phage vB_PtuP_Slicky01]